jgi:Tol biopolymer transport system component
MTLGLLLRLLRVALPACVLLALAGPLAGRTLRADAPLLTLTRPLPTETVEVVDIGQRLRYPLTRMPGYVHWSPDGAAGLLYTARTQSLELLLIDRFGRSRGPIDRDPSVYIEDAAWSPDRRQIAYLAQTLPQITDGAALQALYAVEVPASGPARRPRRLAIHPPKVNARLAWRPGYPQIAFTTRDSLRLYDLDSEAERLLIADSPFGAAPVWSPDGRWLAYAASSGLLLIELDTDGETLHTETYASGLNPVWSPDSRRLAYASARTGTFTSTQLTVIDLAPGQARPLTAHATGDISHLMWSPDSAQILYTMAGRDPSTGAPVRAVTLVHADGGDPRPLPNSQLLLSPKSWSPDGRWLAVIASRSTEDWRLELIDAASLQVQYQWALGDLFTDVAWKP